MGKMINLYMETSKGIISIPFCSIIDVDLFTSEYNSRFDDDNLGNRSKLLDVLIKILKLPISVNDIGRIYLSYKDIDDIEFDYETCLPIKYNRDNYNVDSVIDNFSLYLKRDQGRLNYPGIRDVGKKIFDRFVPGDMSNNDIDFLAKVYLKDDYRKIRDMYFYLSDLDSSYESYNIKIDKLVDNKDNRYSKNISDLESNDDFIQYLIELSSRGESEYDIAREELSKKDLEDIRINIGKVSTSIIDGLCDSKLNDISRDIANLEECTGINIDRLREMCKMQIDNGRGR